MGEEKEEGATTGVTVVNNIDLSTVESELKNLNKVLSGDEKTMIKNIAITLYCNINFDEAKKSPYQLANDSIGRAIILVDSFKKNNIM